MEQLITTFYDSFARLDTATMASCYHEDIIFEDPAFGKLAQDYKKAMSAIKY